jgi:hypothetical protein
MEKIRDYLSNPATRISFIVFIFWLWAVWGTLNSRIQQLEKVQAETDMVKIQATLSQIQTDIERIKYQLKK